MRLLLLFGLGGLVLLAACDSEIAGTAFENAPPDTELSVRDASLVDNLGDADRLTSTLDVSWSGTDPDGFVTAYEIRYYADGAAPPGGGWTRTERTDSLVLLPIPPGARVADVVFEVRAIDNEGLADPDPARTVFPIQNAPPTLQLSPFERPPDTTFAVFSIGFEADDPEGVENLAGVEVSLNDTLDFVRLDPDVSFVSFVGDVDRDDPGQAVTTARLFLGRGFERTELSVDGLRLDAENTLYLRAVDQTDTTSVTVPFSWYVKKPSSRVLLVNDYRSEAAPTVVGYHLDLLRAYGLESVDVWDLSRPTAAEAGRRFRRSDYLPFNAEPTLREVFRQWDHLYWVSTNTTNSSSQNNLPFAAFVLDDFFAEGGTMMVHSPISPPADDEEVNNSAVLLMPLSSPIAYPDSLQRALLSLPNAAEVEPVNPLPGTAGPLPTLVSARALSGVLPYAAEGAASVPLYTAEFTYFVRGSSQRGTWPGASVVASISADARIGLFGLPLINEQTGAPLLVGPDGDPAAAQAAIFAMLESLSFPR